VVGDDEVEVRGTSFAVTAQADRLVGVHVDHGRVEVRRKAALAMMLGSGQSWRPELAAAPPPPQTPVTPAPQAPPPPPAPPPPRVTVERAPPREAPHAPPAPPPDRSPPRRSPEELAYNEAWDALRGNDFRKAALGFERVVALSPAGPLADDAAYWHAVSLARGAHPTEAVAAFREMLDDYPHSPRTGEASVMLGWLLVDANQLDEAERRFRTAATDPSQAVRASARSGLEALAKKIPH
jgi:TolA-binding protein